MSLRAHVVDVGQILTTVKFTSGPNELVRNFYNGDEKMLSQVVESTQKWFLSRESNNPVHLKWKLVENQPELKVERETLVKEIMEGLKNG